MDELTTARCTPTTLADGRELFYYDDSPGYVTGELVRRLDDPRPLPPRFAPTPDGTPAAGPQMRRDPLTGEWVAMASHRMNRPHLPASTANPLAPSTGRADADGEIPADDYDVVVFENRFPSFVTTPGMPDEPTFVDGEPLFESRPASGRCEVICFSPNESLSLKDVSPRRMRTIVQAWAERTTALLAREDVEHVYCFENRGREIGVTLTHPHGQIYGYPFIPPRTAQLVARSREHREATGGCLLRDVLDAELRSGRRIVLDSGSFVAWVPAASRWPLELHLAPRRDVELLDELSGVEQAELAAVYLQLLQAVERFFEGLSTPVPYISGWHQSPSSIEPGLLRLHLQLFSLRRATDKMKYLAGSESGMGSWVSDVTPEFVADRLRSVLD